MQSACRAMHFVGLQQISQTGDLIYHGSTALIDPITTEYHTLCPHYHGIIMHSVPLRREFHSSTIVTVPMLSSWVLWSYTMQTATCQYS